MSVSKAVLAGYGESDGVANVVLVIEDQESTEAGDEVGNTGKHIISVKYMYDGAWGGTERNLRGNTFVECIQSQCIYFVVEGVYTCTTAVGWI